MKFSDEQLNYYKEYRHELIINIALSIKSYTAQLFYDNEKKLPEATGSAILLEVDQKYFLITAAHVIAEHKDTTYLIIGDTAVYLGGNLYSVNLISGKKRIDDKIDLAFIELDSIVVETIKTQHDFLTVSDFQLNHSSNNNYRYFLFGFPSNKTKIKKPDNIIIPYPFIYDAKPCLDFNFEKFGFKSYSHLAINFTGEIKTNKNNNPHLAPNVEGISGSGFWYLPNFPNNNLTTERKLVGIVIERIKQSNQKAIVATSIDIVTETIRLYLGCDSIPKSNKKINVQVNPIKF